MALSTLPREAYSITMLSLPSDCEQWCGGKVQKPDLPPPPVISQLSHLEGAMVHDDVLVRERREDAHFVFHLRTDTRRL
jgi:hypothetical protein